MRLVRVVAPHFVAGFETDGVVRRAAPIINYMVGWTDDRVRVYIAWKGWRASVVETYEAQALHAAHHLATE
jgi:hypothetical protein